MIDTVSIEWLFSTAEVDGSFGFFTGRAGHRMGKKEAPRVLDECIALWVFQSSIFQELGYKWCIMLWQIQMRDHESDSNI